jgi:hypothetical protein
MKHGSHRLLWISGFLTVTVTLSVAPTSADLNGDLCGKLTKRVEHLQSDGTRTSFAIDTLEDRLTPVPHCFIHGTLGGDSRFRIQLPAAWNGKYVLGMGGGWGGSETAAASTIGDIVMVEGYAYAESNQGRPAPIFDPADTWQELHTIRNHQLTQFAKGKIVQRYGRPPQRSYLFGSSGGGWRSLSQLERYPQTYDGAGIRNPAIEPRNLVFTYSVFDRNFPLLLPQLNVIVGARDLGLDPAAVLTAAQAAALNQIYDAGLSRGGEFNWPATDGSTIGLAFPVFRLFDPTYPEDFWTTPGYAGHDGAVAGQIVEGISGAVTAIGAPNTEGQIFDFTDAGQAFATNRVKGYRVTLTSGALAGQSFHVSSNTATRINVTGFERPLNRIAVGDTYTMDNRDWLAWIHYHRHIVQCEFSEFRNFCDGATPRHVQRPPAVQQAYTRQGATLTGQIHAPVVTANQDLDHLVWPPIIHRYFEAVRAALGPRAGDWLRVYWNEHHIHGNPAANQINRIVERDASWHLAFQLMVRWVEDGTPPPPDTVVSITPGRVDFPATASERKGLQPTVSATANGTPRVVVPPGATVVFGGVAASPIGRIAKYEWDFEGNNSYDCDSDPATPLPSCGGGPFAPAPQVAVPAAHVYVTPGTYLATVRVHDDTDNPGPFDGIENVARVIVIVQ